MHMLCYLLQVNTCCMQSGLIEAHLTTEHAKSNPQVPTLRGCRCAMSCTTLRFCATATSSRRRAAPRNADSCEFSDFREAHCAARSAGPAATVRGGSAAAGLCAATAVMSPKRWRCPASAPVCEPLSCGFRTGGGAKAGTGCFAGLGAAVCPSVDAAASGLKGLSCDVARPSGPAAAATVRSAPTMPNCLHAAGRREIGISRMHHADGRVRGFSKPKSAYLTAWAQTVFVASRQLHPAHPSPSRA